MRCLKRRLADVVFAVLVADQAARNPGGQMGATLTSSAADQIPKANTSEKPQPGSATQTTPKSPRGSRLLTQRGTVVRGGRAPS